jgi:hypothetical protein
MSDQPLGFVGRGTPQPGRPNVSRTLFEAGDYDGGDGIRLTLLPDLLLLEVRVHERECEAYVSVNDVLDALAAVTRERES